MTHPLLVEIRKFKERHPRVPDYRIGFASIKNGRLVERLENGGDVGEVRGQEVRAWMAEYDKAHPPKEAAQ